ncbi:putative FMNH2-dependent dimethyl sulfone monooxygenase [Gordonia namibiensis NBRC 108229]|uniref:Putative FMNH2-dependent dimethyl sulfone monooxygenase n=1 Tax=Gordonia namibiensis NBRC 108229 TaxID=1208314 RepID=K6VTQ4_9ACTN|nr:LLM class flavin-dependent oxidoreductase [Gordonia namibiensis]GAB99623.1 putative FMNH2-dependent dimethyl sulfone monooxygenase [Gordonia namibiensis NBRC 108229]
MMKYGVFLPTVNNGYILSKASPQYMPSYELNKQISVDAEAAGYEFVLTMSKFRGYGSEGSGFWDYAQDPLAVVGPLIGATSTVKIWGSVGAPSVHPAMAARIAATYDDASGGRFGINIVAGWNRSEYAQMGLWPGEDYPSKRYGYVDEYVHILRTLWETGRMTYESEHFRLDDCLVQPTPRHGVTVIIPGQSPRSIEAAANRADVNFVLGDFDQVAKARADLVSVASRAGRDVGTAALYGIITAPTDAEAVEMVQSFAADTDVEAADGLRAAAAGDPTGMSAKIQTQERRQVLDVDFDHPTRAAVVTGSCLFHPHLVGSYDRIAAFLHDLDQVAGVDRSVLSFPDYTTDVSAFMQNVAPRVSHLAAV